jgi:hypothetical protein
MENPSILYLYLWRETTMNKSTNYWNWKDSEVLAQLEEYGVVMDHYERRAAIDLLKVEEAKRGITDYVEVDADGNAQTLEEIKEDKPTMEIVKVIFHRTQDMDAPYVFVGLNGVCFYIRRDEEIDIPKYLLDDVIKHAVEDKLMPQTNRDGTIVWITRKVQKYPYSIV